MNDTENVTTTPPCGIFNLQDCSFDENDDEYGYLTLVILALACAVCALCVLTIMLGVLVHKLSVIWIPILLKTTKDQSSDAKSGLLLRAPSDSNPGGRRPRAHKFSNTPRCDRPHDENDDETL